MKNIHHKHLVYWISAGLLISFILSLTGSVFPSQSSIQTILFKVDALFAISAFACLGSKAASESFDIPAAGFTVLAIAQGLFLAEIDHAGHWNFESSNTAILFMIPAIFMISYYTEFPKWLRIGGIISLIPFIMLIFFREFSGSENTSLYENIVFLIYQTVTLCWAWQIWSKRDKTVKG